MWKNLNPHSLLVGLQKCATLGNGLLVLQTGKHRHPAILLLGLKPREMKR